MKLWGKFFSTVLALSLLSYGISDAAYAAVEPLSVVTNKEFYGDGSTIIICTLRGISCQMTLQMKAKKF